MTEKILCLTRGGKSSYPNQDWAITLAKESDAHLRFLYITNVHFLDYTAAPIVFDIEAELDEMGEFLLVMAQERAQKAGVEAEATVRRGEFRQVLEQVIPEFDVDTVIMGSSAEDTGIVSHDYSKALTEDISCKTGVKFIILQEGEVFYTARSGDQPEDEESE
jgi:nucleotide-binding universal stress UspA family protein